MRLGFWLLMIGAYVPGQEEVPVFRSTTKLVQVNVVVQDRQRRAISDLKAEDFALWEAGRPQKIVFFTYEGTASRRSTAPVLPPNVFSNRVSRAGGGERGVTAIVLDMLNTQWKDQAYARSKVLAFLGNIRPDDRVGLYTLGRGLRVLHDYTDDSEALISRLNRHRADGVAEQAAATPDPEFLAHLADGGQVERTLAQYMQANRIRNTLRSFSAIAEHLAAVPGRKSLIWVSGSFPLLIGHDHLRSPGFTLPGQFQIEPRSYWGEVEQVMRKLNHANVSLYPVDARGLMAPPVRMDERGQPSAQAFAATDLDTMQVLADRTGGKAYYNRNDIDGAVREVFAEAAGSYTLGYYSGSDESDGKWRDIRVTVARAGIEARHRKGYFALAHLKADDEPGARTDLQHAVWSPLDSTSVGLNVRLEPVEGGQSYRVLLQIDADTVSLSPRNGRWTGRLNVAIVTKAEDGRHLEAFTDSIGMNLMPETYDSARKGGILYERRVRNVKGAASLRVVARDAASGLTGSVTIPWGRVR